MLRILLEIPISIARGLTEAIEFACVFFTRGNFDPGERHLFLRLMRAILFLPVLFVWWAIKWIFGVFVSPIEFFRAGSAIGRTTLLGTPALLTFVAILGVSIFIWYSSDSSQAKYIQRMQAAYANQDFELARDFGQTLMAGSRNLPPEFEFLYAKACQRSNQVSEANSIFQRLAPDNRIGFSAAHEERAIEIGKSLSDMPTNGQLELLRWHLMHSGNKSSESALTLWATYYQHVDQFEKAIEMLVQASKLNPIYQAPLSDLLRKTGNEREADRVLREACKSLREVAKGNPNDKRTRLQFALILSRLEEWDEAESTLRDGLLIARDLDLCRATADFYLLKYDKIITCDGDLSKCFEMLRKAISTEPTYVPIYDRLVQLHSKYKTFSLPSPVVPMLEEMIAEGNHSAFAHFALSSVFLIDGRSQEAIGHLDSAFRLDPDIPVVCNNLAWILATNQPPRLDEALELARHAVEIEPTSASYRDTLGTILLKQGRFSEATMELETLLGSNPGDQRLHSKLAEAYEALGKKEIARLHREKAIGRRN